jgi:cyclopropane-fatty-acyl-phospholipid synthase
MFWQERFHQIVERMRNEGIPVRIRLWNGTEVDLAADPRVTIEIPAAAALRHFSRPTLATLGDAYVAGEINVEGKVTDMVDAAVRIAVSGPSRDGCCRPRLRGHNRRLDAAAIAYHYDVSNDFYRQWLDPGMVYSCAYFRHEEDTLAAAQEQKIDHILRKLQVRPGNQLLDIGCGWGALIMRAAEKYGARALGITLSRNQYELARERIAAAGLEDRCEVRLEDYRDVAGRFDRIASVGMFEHVGFKNLRRYFGKIHDLLADDGIALNHGITDSDPDGFDDSSKEAGNFIKRYVFPHSELPHLSVVLKEMSAAGLEALDVESLRRHYALTLQHWSERFEAASERLREMAGEKRWRIWRVYLAGCAYAFAHNWISVHQVLAVKAGRAVLPLTRDYMYGERESEEAAPDRGQRTDPPHFPPHT